MSNRYRVATGTEARWNKGVEYSDKSEALEAARSHCNEVGDFAYVFFGPKAPTFEKDTLIAEYWWDGEGLRSIYY